MNDTMGHGYLRYLATVMLYSGSVSVLPLIYVTVSLAGRQVETMTLGLTFQAVGLALLGGLLFGLVVSLVVNSLEAILRERRRWIRKNTL